MYKGCEKRMIKIKNTGSDLFEEAYFILNGRSVGRVTRYDMVKEANRIVNENGLASREGRALRSHLLPYILGAMTGSGITLLLLSFFG